MASSALVPIAQGGVFADMRVRTKILCGFSVVLLVLVGALAFAYVSFVSVSHDVEEYAVYVEEASAISEIEARFLKFNSHAREFANTANQADAKQVFLIAEELVPMLEHAREMFVSEDRRARIDHIAASLDAYLANFTKAKQLSDEYHSLILEELEPSGIKILSDLNQLAAYAGRTGDFETYQIVSDAREHALLARLYANILIGRQDDSFGEKSADEFRKLEAALTALDQKLVSPDGKQVLADAVTILRDYRTVFEKIRADELLIEENVNGAMREESAQIVADAEDLKQELSAVEKSIFQDVLAKVSLAEKEILIASLAGVVLGIAIAWILGDRLSKPIIAIAGVMRKLADHDLTVTVPGQGRGDEIGTMAAAVQVFKASAIRNDELEAQAREQEARAKEAQRVFMNQTADSFTNSVGGIIEAVAAAAVELQATANAMSQIARNASEQTTAVASATEQASGNVHSVASATEELNAAIEEINRQVVFSSEVAKKAVEQAHEAFTSMTELVDASNDIEEVLQLITDISNQTNMLALNATIEAQRAGASGAGFAVVANEVKTLASQTAKATDEIRRQVAGVQSRTGNASNQIEQISKTISEMEGIVATISSAVEEQSAATREIAANIEQAATGTTVVSSNIVTVSEAVNEAGTASGDVLTAVDMLSQNFDTLKGATDTFVTKIRAA